MQQAETYNGWTNYETWGCALVLDNDYDTHTMIRERIAELREDADEDGRLSNGGELRYELADYLKDLTETLCGTSAESEAYGIPEPSLMASQLLGIHRVDFTEIALNLLADA